jgi:hypothetical protein
MLFRQGRCQALSHSFIYRSYFRDPPKDEQNEIFNLEDEGMRCGVPIHLQGKQGYRENLFYHFRRS